MIDAQPQRHVLPQEAELVAALPEVLALGLRIMLVGLALCPTEGKRVECRMSVPQRAFAAAASQKLSWDLSLPPPNEGSAQVGTRVAEARAAQRVRSRDCESTIRRPLQESTSQQNRRLSSGVDRSDSCS